MIRILRFLAPLFRRGGQGNNKIEQLPEEDSLAHARKMLARARRQLEHKNEARAQIYLGFGELLAGDARVEYLLDAGRLWMEFGHWPQAYDRFLAADLQAEDSSLQEAIQFALLDLESTLALRNAKNKQSPHTGFWTCLVARREGTALNLPLNKAWQQLEASDDAQNRALEGVGILATARYFVVNVGNIRVVTAYVSQAPQSLTVLEDFRRFVQSLRQWKTLNPITEPWLQVLDAVVLQASPRFKDKEHPTFSMDGRTS